MECQDPESTRHVLQGRELIDYLVEKASGATNAELLAREERRNRRVAALFSVVTFIGLGAIVGAIKMFVQQEIELSERRLREQVTVSMTEEVRRQHDEFQQNVTGSIAGRVDEQVGVVRAELEHYKVYQELIAHAEGVNAAAEEERIAEGSVAAAVEAIGSLADVASIRSQPRFLESVNVVVSVLARADRVSEIAKIDKLLGDVMGRHKEMALDLVDHYGELIIASPYGPEKLKAELAALARYATAAREHGYPERALMWELFVAYKSSGYQATRTTESMVEMMNDLKPVDLQELCYQLAVHSHPLHWMKRADHEGREMARVVTGLMQDHATLRKTFEEQAADESLAERLEGLAALRRERSGEAEEPVAEENAAEEPVEVAEAPAASGNTLRR